MSELRVNAVKDTAGVERYLARAWVNFNGTGTVAIRASGNVTSITDNGTGDYTVNFTNAMPDANYSVVCSTRLSTSGTGTILGRITNANPALTTTSARVSSQNLADARGDVEAFCVAIFR